MELVFNLGIRFLEVSGSKISRVIPKHTAVRTEFAGSVVAEEIHPEEANKQTGDRIINVAHAWSGKDGKQVLRYFGNPFRCISKKVCCLHLFVWYFDCCRTNQFLLLRKEYNTGWQLWKM